jgi:hypothetical protein
MRRRELVPILALAVVGVVLLTRSLAGSGAGSTGIRILVLAVVVGAILATRLGPRGH